MQRIAGLLACVGLAACHYKPTEGGLQVTAHTDKNAFVTCMQLDVLDSANKTLGSVKAPVTNHADVNLAVAQASFPNTVTLVATGLYGTQGCTNAVPNSTPARTGFTFTPGVTLVEMTVHRPATADDADGDGFTTAAKGGPDCDDSNAAANPAATEMCTVVVDLNCNGKYGCDDPACPKSMCILPPAQLGFASAPQAATSLSCSSAIIVELRDSTNMPVPAGADTSVTLTEMGGLSLDFYSDSSCTIPARTGTIAKGQHQVRFFARGSKAGTTQLSASAAGVSSVQQDFVVSPGPVVGLFFTTLPQSVKADHCSGAVRIEPRDMQSNPAPVGVDTPFTVTAAPPMNISFFSDASCMTALTLPKLAAGTSQTIFYFLSTAKPETVTLTVAAAPLTQATQDEAILPGDPDSVVFTTPQQTITAGACSGALSLKLLDSHGTDTTVASATQVMLTGPATFFTNATCTTPANGVALIPAAMGAATVYFTATTSGMPVLTATAPGLAMPVTQTETVNPGPPAQLVFPNGLGGIAQSTCSSAVALAVRDTYGNATVTGTALPITLSASPPAGFTFYNPGACGTPTTSVTIAPGTGTASFNFEGTLAGPVTVTASSALKPDPSLTIHIGVGPAAQLVFTTLPQTKLANQCSSALTVQAEDSGGNVVGTMSQLTVGLAASPGTNFTFYSDSSCTNAISQTTIPMGGSQATFYFLGKKSGAQMLTASSAPLTAAMQTQTIQPAAASKLIFTNTALTVTAGVCSMPLGLQSQDAFSNVSPVTADTVLSLSASPPGNITFFSDAACATAVPSVTMLNGSSTATFYVRANTAPQYMLNVTGALGSVSQTLTVTPAAASQLVFLTMPQTLATGVCSAKATLQRLDAFANPVSSGAATVSFSQSVGGGLQFFSDMGCGTPAPSIVMANNASTVDVYFLGTVPGMPTLTATVIGLTPANQKQNINVAGPTKLSFTSAQQLSVPAGACSAVVTVESQDNFNNPSPVGAATTVTLGGAVAPAQYYSDVNCMSAITQTTIPLGSSTASWYFKGTLVSSFTMTANSAVGNASQGAGIVAGALNALKIATSPRSQAVGLCSQNITVQRVDQFNNPVIAGGALAVTLMSSTPAVTTFSDVACASGTSAVTIQPGQSTVDFYFADTMPGSPMLTVSASGATPASQTETVTNTAPTRVVFTTSAQAVVAGACSGAMTVQARDMYGNPEPVAAATLVTLSASPANVTFFSDMTCTTPVSNVTIPIAMTDATFYASGTTASTPMVTAAPAGLTSASQLFTLSPAAASKLAYTPAGPVQVGVGQCSSGVTVQTQDTYGNVSAVTSPTTLSPAPSPGTLVSFFSEGTCTTPLGAGVALMATQSSGSFFMKGGGAMGAGTVTTSSAPLALTATAPLSVTVVAGPPSQVAVTSGVQTLMAGQCSAQVRLQLEDTANDATFSATATLLNLSVSPTTGFAFYSDSSCTVPITTATVPSGAPGFVDVYVKGLTGGAFMMTASPSTWLPGSQSVTVLNAVMTGSCTLTNGTSTVTCNISPALADTTKTMLMFQAANQGTGPASSSVRCELTNTTTISCFRGGTAGDINIRWYTLAKATGFRVQHFNGITVATNDTGTTYDFTAVPFSGSSVNMASSFVLLSTDYAAATYNGQLTSVRMVSNTTFAIQRLVGPTTTMHYSLQLVEWTGATVEHVSTSIPDMALTSGSVTVADDTGVPTFLLSTWRWGDASTDQICRQSVQVAPVDSTHVAATRGAGAMGACKTNIINVEIERVRLPVGNRVDVLGQAPAAGMDGTIITLPNGAVDLTRSLAFFSAQGFNGQSAGECTSTTNELPRDCTMRAVFTDNQNLGGQRPVVAGSSAAAFTLFMLQLAP